MNVHTRNKLHLQIFSVLAVSSALTSFAWGQSFPYQPLQQSALCGQTDPVTGEPISCYTNKDSIANTRHNMRQPWSKNLNGPASPIVLDVHNNARNDYEEVCVYCHTPHGSNSTIAIPLWNRTNRPTTYQTYNQLGTGSFSVDPSASMQPGAASLSCLSCHDGQTAIDSIINMPGSGRYLASQQTTQNVAFLNSWNPASGVVVPGSIPDTASHKGMNSNNTTLAYTVGNGTGSDGIGCLACHSGVGSLSGGADHDMRLALIGTDLRNDHPIGVKFPTNNGAGTDWKTPTAAGSISFFENSAGTPGLDKSDIRLYQTAGEARVECASCHDPHGVPSAGPGSEFIKTFLRKDNKASGVCFSCHSK